MPPEGVKLSKENELLSVDEITRIRYDFSTDSFHKNVFLKNFLKNVFSTMLTKERSLKKVRLTGGNGVISSDFLFF